MNWYTVGEILIIVVVILFVIRMIRRSITKRNRLPSSAGYTPHDEIYGGSSGGGGKGPESMERYEIVEESRKKRSGSD
ncbi:hypothetical protein [Guptibacillus algicola]|uniref:hypothetical protein n=1 Tax=Guptibacillus algicola TaxID=225844 RepID=UPI001CD7600C|nr:hypothetical protein [Alkalihalobacillus algicola]MCA0988562.1 hypothetical protein [Alkalihalobacillus algicola]